MLVTWINHFWLHRNWSVWTLTVARCVAAVGSLATYAVGLVGLALATGNVWGTSEEQGTAVKYAFVVGAALLTLLIPGTEVKDVIPAYASVDTKV